MHLLNRRESAMRGLGCIERRASYIYSGGGQVIDLEAEQVIEVDNASGPSLWLGSVA